MAMAGQGGSSASVLAQFRRCSRSCSSTLKVRQMLVLNHFHVLSPLSDMVMSEALHHRSCHIIRRCGLNGGRITFGRRAVQGIKRGRQNVDDFRDVLADRAEAQGAPRSLRITFRRCDPPCSRSRALPQRPNGVCRLGRPKAHEVGLPRSRHR
jgi:hypothetical protein